MIKIERLTRATKEDVDDINRLLPQLSANVKVSGTLENLEEMVNDKRTLLFVGKDAGRIVAMGTLYIIQKITKQKAFLENVVVDSDYRGQGLGEKVIQALIDAGKSANVSEISLTSNPSREAANHLYQKLGFQKKETNVYRMKL